MRNSINAGTDESVAVSGSGSFLAHRSQTIRESGGYAADGTGVRADYRGGAANDEHEAPATFVCLRHHSTRWNRTGQHGLEVNLSPDSETRVARYK